MIKNQSNELIEKFTQFRQDLYDCFDARQDTVMDLLDALASNNGVRSTVELSLNPLFRRDYSALYKAIEEAFAHDPLESDGSNHQTSPSPLLEVLAQVVPPPKVRPYLLLGLDTTPNPRPYALTLEDRTFIYQPNTIRGNKPINIGHPYSILSVLPEKTAPHSEAWVIPLSAVRVERSQTEREVGTVQINLLLNHPAFSEGDQFFVLVVDSGYSAPPFVKQQVAHENLVTIGRVRSNRVFYQSPNACSGSNAKK